MCKRLCAVTVYVCKWTCASRTNMCVHSTISYFAVMLDIAVVASNTTERETNGREVRA